MSKNKAIMFLVILGVFGPINGLLMTIGSLMALSWPMLAVWLFSWGISGYMNQYKRGLVADILSMFCIGLSSFGMMMTFGLIIGSFLTLTSTAAWLWTRSYTPEEFLDMTMQAVNKVS